MNNIKTPLFFGLAFLIATILFNACKEETKPPREKRTFTTVNGFTINETGEKLLATDNGLFVLNESNGEFDFIENENDLKPFNDIGFSKSSLKKLWLASNEGVLNLSDNQLLNSSNSGLKSNSVYKLNFDYSNRGIFANPEGLSIDNNGKWIQSSGQDDLYLNFEITDIASTVNGYTFISTNGGGVERIEMDVDGISGATIFNTDWTLLESNNINTVFTDSATQAYGTDMGVAIHYSEYTKWDWEAYTSEDGLIDNNVISVVKDLEGNWWFGTTKGLSRFVDSEWTTFTKESDNLICNNIKFLAADIDGSIWIACDDGLSQFLNKQWTNYLK